MTTAEFDEQLRVQIEIARMMPAQAILSIDAISIMWSQYLNGNPSNLYMSPKSLPTGGFSLVNS
jgi:hypothetical protein